MTDPSRPAPCPLDADRSRRAGTDVRPDAGRRRLLRALAGAPLAGLVPAWAAASDERASPGPYTVAEADAIWHDAARHRDIPVRVRTPAGAREAPLILFSHGLGGSRAGGAQWTRHWTSHGYATLVVQHPGSDESLWRGAPEATEAAAGNRGAGQRLLGRLRAGISVSAFLDRVADVRFAIDTALGQRGRPGAPLAAIDGERIGMSGHSFGAVTTEAVCGERFAGGAHLADPRIRAGVAFSPSSGRPAGGEARFADVTMPMLLVTGTRDGDVIGNGETPASRQATFDRMPPPGKYLLVLDGATHMDFNGGERQNAGAAGRHYRAAVDAITLAFWDAALRGERAARAWLDAGAADALDPGDRFASK